MRHNFTEEQRQNALKWIVTLESGNYKQGKYVLRNINNECCCLGVWCDIYAPDQWGVTLEGSKYYHTPIRNTSYPVAEDYTKYLGLKQIDMDILATFNDDRNMSFKEIAKVLREWYGFDK
jgi:hypothetical protein